MVSARHITLYFDDKKILDDISFEIKPKDTLVLMGKNGCGKTVLLKTLIGLFAPQEGESVLFDQNIHQLKGSSKNEILQRAGYVFQKSGLFDSLNILENVLFGLQRFSSEDIGKQITAAQESLYRTGLKGAEEKKPSELSGGMQKRASIARAIVSRPELLFLDDPTAGLDPVLTDSIGNLILEIKEKLNSTFLIVTHDLELAYKLADRIGLIIDGKLHGILTVEDFKTTREAYFTQFREGKLEGPISVL